MVCSEVSCCHILWVGGYCIIPSSYNPLSVADHTLYDIQPLTNTSSFDLALETKFFVYYSDICTSSSPVAGGGAAGADAEADAAGAEAEAGGTGASFGCMVWRYTSIGEPSRTRKSTVVPAPSCMPPGPTMLIGFFVGRELLVLLEQLAKGVQPVVDQVFQTACTHVHIHTYLYSEREKWGDTYSRQGTRIRASRGRSWHSARAD